MLDHTLLAWKLDRGQEAALKSVYRLYKDRLFTVAAILTGDEMSACRILHDTFISLAGRRRCRLPVPGGLRLFLFARTVELARLRLTEENYQVVEDQRLGGATPRPVCPPAVGAAIRDGGFDEMLKLLADLPLEQREAVVLGINGGMSFFQIASVQKTAAANVKARYQYGLDKLRGMASASTVTPGVRQAILGMRLETTAQSDQWILDDARKALAARQAGRRAGLRRPAIIAAAILAVAVLLSIAVFCRKDNSPSASLPVLLPAGSPESNYPDTRPVIDEAPAFSSVSIEVADRQTDQPVPGKTIWIVHAEDKGKRVATAQTGRLGEAMVRLPAGRYTALVEGWKDSQAFVWSDDFTVQPGSEGLALQIAIGLRPMLYGFLEDLEGRHVRGTVALGPTQISTDQGGEFLLPEPNDPVGTAYVCWAVSSDGERGRAFLWEKAQSPADLRIVLEGLAAVAGRMENASADSEHQGLPVLEFLPDRPLDYIAAPLPPVRTIVHQDGTFLMEGIPTGLPVRISVNQDPDRGGRHIIEELYAGRTIEIPSLVSPGALRENPDIIETHAGEPPKGTLGGVVTDQSGVPLAGIEVWATDMEGKEMGVSSITDLEGRYNLSGLVPLAAVVINLEGSGYGHSSFETVCDGNDLDIQLEAQ